MPELAAVVSWFGPYLNLNEARTAAKAYYGAGLYAAFGYENPPIKGRPRLLYVGLAKNLSGRLSNNHKKIGINSVAKLTSIWLGEISSHLRAGRRQKKTEPLMDAVEWAMIALLQPRLNERKTTFPNQSFAIMNRWWSKIDYETAIPKPAILWPDVIECAGAHADAHLCWLEQKKVKVFSRPPL